MPTLVFDVLEPEGVTWGSTAVCQGRRARRAKTGGRCRKQPQEGARNDHSVVQGAMEHHREHRESLLDVEREGS